MDQRNDGEGKLHAQDDLAQDQEAQAGLLARDPDGQRRGDDGQSASGQTAQPGAHADGQESFHHDLAGHGAGHGGRLAGAEQGNREDHARHTRPQQRRQQLVSLLNLGHDDVPLEEHRARHHQDGDVDQHGSIERHHRIDQVEAAGRALLGVSGPDASCLHQRRVQVQVVRHHRGAQDPDHDVEVLVAGVRDQPAGHLREGRLCHQDLNPKAHRHDGDEAEHKALDHADAEAGEPQQQQDVERGEQHAGEQGNVEQQVQADRGAEHFGQVAGCDGDLAEPPQRQVHGPRIGFAAGLREVPLAGDAEPGRQGLEQDRHEVRHDEDPQQLVTEFGAAFEIGGPVARVHVAHRNQVGGSREGEHPPPDGRLAGVYAPVHFRQRLRARGRGSGVRHPKA